MEATYVGRLACIQCHAKQAEQWTGSDHDLAMDRATAQTVLGNFDNTELTHYGITSRMYRDDARFMIHTEGPDGEMDDFQIKYVFGVEPLQQYMVELDRSPDAGENEVGRLQVLRVSWDTEKKQWYYLSPPDVDEGLAPDDPLHWTQSAQNWNHMCAACHSTNLQKNFDVKTKTYHTTFSDIDVSCEACHGRGSIHVQLAKSRSLFWDRRHGYGLAQLKSKDTHVEIETCAGCHSRRHEVYPNYRPGESYYDNYMNELLQPDTYYPDGQILDEVYVYGSFIQSKMYHQGIRCTDCHNPHTARLKYEGNQLCTSCHTHDPAKYETPAHHRHNVGSTGAACVECHMPASPFMDVDPRRDHSFRVPRPDLSVKLGTPNACTGCHLDTQKVDAEKRAGLPHYADWLAAARAGDEQVRDELSRLDQWAMETVEQWYGERKNDENVEFAETLARAWRHEPDVAPDLMRLIGNRRASGMVRASALDQLLQFPSEQSWTVARRALDDVDPQVRAVAIRNLENLPRRRLLETITPLLDDPVRTVRIAAARALANLPPAALTAPQLQLREVALEEYQRGLMVQSDQAGAHMAMGVLWERQRQFDSAVTAYRTAIHVQPGVTGPRTNLAALLERLGGAEDETLRFRREELELFGRDARLVPQSAALQYRLGFSLYRHKREKEAEAALSRACQLEPNVPEYLLALISFYHKQGRLKEAIPLAEKLCALRPHDPTYRQILEETRQPPAPRR